MKEEHLELIINLENILAGFYEKIKSLPRAKGAQYVLEYMETHSYAHAKEIDQLKKTLKKPDFKKNLIIDFQKKLMKSTFEEITKQKDIVTVLKMLANSEESIGNLYRSIVLYLMNMSRYYSEIAQKVNEIADQENQHRDLLLSDRERLIEKGYGDD